MLFPSYTIATVLLIYKSHFFLIRKNVPRVSFRFLLVFVEMNKRSSFSIFEHVKTSKNDRMISAAQAFIHFLLTIYN